MAQQGQDHSVNYEKKPIPSGPGAQQITTIGQETMKGGSAMNSKMPTEYVIPDGAGKGKGFNKA